MVRNLKLAVAVAAVVSLLAVVTAPASQAAEFHCSVAPCTYTLRQDGSGRQGHQVLIIENAAQNESVTITCNEISGDGTVGAMSTKNIAIGSITYQGCKVNATVPLEVAMNGCKYSYTSAGELGITGCEAGKTIEFKYNECKMTIPEQGPLMAVTFTTIGAAPTREITLSPNLAGSVTADGTAAKCLINPSQNLNFTYTTGNAILRGETAFGVMSDLWFE